MLKRLHNIISISFYINCYPQHD